MGDQRRGGGTDNLGDGDFGWADSRQRNGRTCSRCAMGQTGANWGGYSTFFLNGQFRESGIRGRGGKGTGVIRSKCQSSH